MGEAPHTAGGALSNGKLKLADAVASNVLKGKKFYAGDKTLKTGTGVLTPNTSSTYVNGAGANDTKVSLSMKATLQSNGSIVISAEAISRDEQGYEGSGAWHRKSSITVQLK